MSTRLPTKKAIAVGTTKVVKKKRIIKKRPKLSPEERKTARAKLAFERKARGIYSSLGFSRISSDGKEIEFKGRTGELDDIFIFENIVVIGEYTVGKPNNAHVLKKKIIFDLILDNPTEFLKYARTTYKNFGQALSSGYPDRLIKIKIVYISSFDVSDEARKMCDRVNFLSGSTLRYFQALCSTIERSARMEFFKFLKLPFKQVGSAALTASNTSTNYNGFILPTSHSDYPEDSQIVSFYADPDQLIKLSYVLRRDGWRDDNFLYQRILIPKKIRAMRRYLTDEGRVFVNNIVVTLPSDTTVIPIHDDDDDDGNDLNKLIGVKIQIPQGFDKVGIVDGQHRVFCYHEGTDSAEARINELRVRQHLMVTGIIYGNKVTEAEKRRFEARLFLEINDNQARAKSALKQEIEVIVRPKSALAISKCVIRNLGRRGIYNELLNTSHFDIPAKIKTSSIVSYGLIPIVKMDGLDSLFSAWTHPNKMDLKKVKFDEALLAQYIEYCSNMLSEFFIRIKALTQSGGIWEIEAKPRHVLMNPTAINGMIVLLRKLIESGADINAPQTIAISKIDGSVFLRYKSSAWKLLGEELLTKYVRQKK